MKVTLRSYPKRNFADTEVTVRPRVSLRSDPKECGGGESVSGQECGGNKLWDNHFSFMAPTLLLMETDNSSSAFSRRGKDGKMIV